jgi:hypothetical protein
MKSIDKEGVEWLVEMDILQPNIETTRTITEMRMKSAVEFLASVLSQSGQITKDDFDSLVKQALEMEQAQKERSRVIGYSQGYEHAMNMVGIDVNEH